MSNTIDQLDQFKDLLSRHHQWPEQYTFKFIIKSTELPATQQLFQGESLSIRESGTGKYLSVTFTKTMDSSEEVLSMYKKASIIPGLIAL